MNTYLEQVKEFHETFNHPVSSFKDDIDLKTRQLRIKLIFEELEELAVAADVQETFSKLCETVCNKSEQKKDGDNVNKKEELDALSDIQYVLSGSILSLGYQDVFDDAFSEVHSSNMTKACTSVDEALTTEMHYLKKDGTDAYHVEKNGLFLVYRVGDNKTLKNVNYRPANLDKFLS